MGKKVNALADADPEASRISMDTKATVHVGEYVELAGGLPTLKSPPKENHKPDVEAYGHMVSHCRGGMRNGKTYPHPA